MERIQYNLIVARENLQYAQSDLWFDRKMGFSVKKAEGEFLRCLDRAWEAQCMAQGSL